MSRSSQTTVIAVANAKGGVGKTSIVSNAAGIATLAGWRVLVIDLDPQGNLATDLRYQDRSDSGLSLGTAIRRGEPPHTISEVRPGLDAWAGGPLLEATVTQSLIPEVDHPLRAAIDAAADRYDVVLIDCPPTQGPLVDAGLTAADWLVVPVRADHASLHGLEMIVERAHAIGSVANPSLAVLGVALFDLSPQATAIAREIAAAVKAIVGADVPLLQPPIRRSERTAYDMRRLGLLAHEYEEQYLDEERVPLAERIAAARRGEQRQRFSAASSGVANDYFELTKAILTAVNTRRARQVPSAASRQG